jgi:hypothetical protein
MARLAMLHVRRQWLERVTWAAAALVPGAAGLLRGRPFLGLFGAACGSLAVVCLTRADRFLSDPLAAGAAGGAVFLLAGSLGALVHLALALHAVLRSRGA